MMTMSYHNQLIPKSSDMRESSKCCNEGWVEGIVTVCNGGVCAASNSGVCAVSNRGVCAAWNERWRTIDVEFVLLRTNGGGRSALISDGVLLATLLLLQ
jgi:hypothetical protein